MKSILSNIKQLLFSKRDTIDSVISNSYVACVNLIKCMEFYTDKGCDADLDHWINVATTQFDNSVLKDQVFGGCFILQGLSRKFISSYFKEDRILNSNKYNSQNTAIESFKKEIETAKNNGNLKYYDLLDKNERGIIQWKYSNKYYDTFFELLGYLLNFQISLYDLQGIGIDPESGKIWGGRVIPRIKPITIHDSGISKYDFQTLIYKYIYLMNYGQLNGNKELARRISKGI